jgi:hypothetical protein
MESCEQELRMNELLLCLQLRESLDAASRGEVYEGIECIGDWGRAVVVAFENLHPKYRHPRHFVWHMAHNTLQNVMMNCSCEGLAQEILGNPESFLRSILILSSRRPSKPENRSKPCHLSLVTSQ